MFWWSKASWPATKKEERRHPFFEDIRKLIFLIENPAAGNFDVYRIYGKSLDGDITYVPYDEQNWAGSWDGYVPPNLAKEGWVKIVYKDFTGTEDIYINHKEMSEADLEKHPPIQSDGKLDKRYWRLGVNPNYYCHYNQNAGKPEINAFGRYHVIYHAASAPAGLLSYVCELKAHKWLPRHTHPERQVPPVKYKSGVVKQRRDPALYGVETKNKYISQNPGTQWPRDYEAKYRKITEYVMELGEPDAGVDNQYGLDPKMCEAYQDRAIRTCEHETRYLTEVDQTYIDAWTKREGGEWPVYDRFGARFFCCNGSAFEKVLKNIGHYDWWWDSAYPYIPKALKDLRDAEGPANWPLPCGCWRRTWRHSMGRVGALMWPGESGPPEYHPDHWSVTQQVYDTIPGGNQHEYKVVNNPPDFVLTEEQEAALVKRHDAKASSSAKINGATIVEPHYEIHHDLVNDIWNALKELHLINWPYSSKCWNELVNGVWPEYPQIRDSSLAAYASSRFLFEKYKVWVDNGWDGGMPAKKFGYRSQIMAHDLPPVEYWAEGPYVSDFSFRLAVNLRVPKNKELPGLLSGRLLLRVEWKGMDCTVDPDITCFAPCTFGFENKTLIGVCGHTVYRYDWVALEPRAPFTSGATYNYYMFYGYVLSPWPYTKNGECMDWEWVGPLSDVKFLRSHVTIKVPSYQPDVLQSIFDIDWDKVKESVFEENESNAIKIGL